MSPPRDSTRRRGGQHGTRSVPCATWEDDPADHPLPRGGAGTRGPGRDRQGRPGARDWPAAELGVGGASYRVAYREGDGDLVEAETDDPTSLLNDVTGRALARGERLSEISVGRPTLEDVYLELTADA